jgi:hypothetical protein
MCQFVCWLIALLLFIVDAKIIPCLNTAILSAHSSESTVEAGSREIDSKGSHGLGRILVTGGAGYIATHTIICLLEAGYDVTVVDNLINSCHEG